MLGLVGQLGKRFVISGIDHQIGDDAQRDAVLDEVGDEPFQEVSFQSRSFREVQPFLDTRQLR